MAKYVNWQENKKKWLLGNNYCINHLYPLFMDHISSNMLLLLNIKATPQYKEI